MKHKHLITPFVAIECLLISLGAFGSDIQEKKSQKLDTIEVDGHYQSYIGESLSTSEGVIGDGEIKKRPLLRTGEVLEFVPGMAITQHSGSGKANQYFLRGFNLDHGTDFSLTVDGMPVNMRTHGHGQGYMDMNFIIPEMIKRMYYQKGIYYPQNGDFSSAGAAHIDLPNNLKNGTASIEVGQYNYGRVVVMDGFKAHNGNLIMGVEGQTYDGPWTDIKEDEQKKNFIGRYVGRHFNGDFAVTLMAYDNSWNSADQIPQRAVDQGLIDTYGSLDTSLGGKSNRFSLSSSWKNKGWATNFYIIKSNLNLWSDFTYYLDNPTKGDQFEQVDKRWIYGGEVKRNWSTSLGAHYLENKLGVQARYDDIGEVALYNTQNRVRYNTIRKDKVSEQSVGVYYQGDLELTSKLNFVGGLRYDYFSANVDSDNVANSGSVGQGISSLKGALTYTITPSWEAYLNAGQGFHSNDARGATITVDPQTHAHADKVDLLVRSVGAETGVRFSKAGLLNASLAFWWLKLDSELLFVGDAGNTEATRPSERLGVEFASYYRLVRDVNLDFEASYTDSHFTDKVSGEGKYIEDALPIVVSAGISHMPKLGWHQSLRLRYLGARPLTSDNSVKSKESTILNAAMGYAWKKWKAELEVFNLLDSRDHDIDYYYTSRLSSAEPAQGVDDIHFHPVEPRTLRFKVSYLF